MTEEKPATRLAVDNSPSPFHSYLLFNKIGKTATYHLLRGLSPQANYTDRATAACRRS
jgi:hypothetical protein